MHRTEINKLASREEIADMKLALQGIDDHACALLGFQRTKQVSNKSRLAWESGDPDPMYGEISERRDDIIRGAFLEIYQEYLPLKAHLADGTISRVCDIGCGQGINNVFLFQDFAPHFTLVDIESTDEQYHHWADAGSGYASLTAARDLLIAQGATEVEIFNPTKEGWPQTSERFDLVTSLYSCGFHYPVDEYLPVFLDAIDTGGTVVLDLRKQYIKRNPAGLKRLNAVAKSEAVYEDHKSFRMVFSSL